MSHIVVSDLQNDTFFAKVVLHVDSKSMEVDCRPSDAIALAVRTEAPIYVEDMVLDKAGIILDKETGKPLIPGEEGEEEKPREVKEEELKRLSAFTDFISTLDLEDLGKSSQQGS